MTVYHQNTLQLETPGRSIISITDKLRAQVDDSGVATGLCHAFIQHTSASLIVTENADPDVHLDLETYLSSLAPDADPRYQHTAEGPDDMAAHVRSALTLTELSIPISKGRLALGTWQGVYLWEHRHRSHRRSIVLTIHGER